MDRRTLVAVAALLATGCLPQTWRVHPTADGWRAAKRVAVVSSVRVFEISAGDVREEQEEWTAASSRLVHDALVAGLEANGLASRRAATRAGDDELDEVVRLYEQVGSAIWTFAYPPFPNEHKVRRFEYGVGPIAKVLDRTGADLLLVAHARDQVSTTGRKVLTLLSSKGYDDMAMLFVALVDADGRIVWFDVAGGMSYDLRDPADVQKVVGDVMAHLAGVLR